MRLGVHSSIRANAPRKIGTAGWISFRAACPSWNFKPRTLPATVLKSPNQYSCGVVTRFPATRPSKYKKLRVLPCTGFTATESALVLPFALPRLEGFETAFQSKSPNAQTVLGDGISASL